MGNLYEKKVKRCYNGIQRVGGKNYMKKEVVNSPIRWAGSKKKLLNEMLEKTFVRDCENYVECFLGSGVVLLNVLNNAQELGYKKFYVNDINSNIINFYTMLQKEPKYLIDNIQKMSQKYNVLNIEQQSAMYYEIREAFNKGFDVKEKTIYFYC